ncbi:MAG TPA: oligosaccharide flippase family protein [Steroidobacteraceae bacterium]|jgi:O-antigen/teichoic acid export membrane protein
MWMLTNTFVTKVLSLVAQIAMGWFLSDRDFGVYAIAVSISTVASLLRDGGLSRLLIKRGAEFDQLQGPVFWMMLAFNSFAALLLVAIAPMAARFYAEPQLQGLLLLVALYLPLLAPGSVLAAKASLDLKYREIGVIQLGSCLLRYLGMVALAKLGFGAKSFLLPVMAVALYEWLSFWLVSKSKPWRCGPGFRSWPGLFQQTKWVLLGTFAVGLINYGVYFVIGKLVAQEVVGIYFFAFQIVLQVGVLLSNNLYQVLFPAFVRIAQDKERSRAALERSINIVMLAATWLSMILVPLFAPIEALIWHGKWASSTASVQILSITYPPSVALSVVMAIQSARGQFKEWGLMTLAIAVGSVIAAGIGAYWGRTSEAIAIASGAFTMVGTYGYAWIALRQFDLGIRSLVASLLPAWLIGLAAAMVTMLARLFIANAAGRQAFHSTWYSIADIGITALLFSFLYFVGARNIKGMYLRQIIPLLPVRVGAGMSWLLS